MGAGGLGGHLPTAPRRHPAASPTRKGRGVPESKAKTMYENPSRSAKATLVRELRFAAIKVSLKMLTSGFMNGVWDSKWCFRDL